MEKMIRQNFETLYTEYVQWHRERAVDGSRPRDPEDIAGYRNYSEDVYEDENILLNRVYFLASLSPSQTVSGKLELFAFSELNLMVKLKRDKGDEILGFHTIEYRREPIS